MRKRFFLLAVISCLLAQLAFADGGNMPNAKVQLFDDSGNPCAKCSLYSYQAGTTTPLATYNDADLAVGHQNTNPVVLDSAGRATIYLAASSYKFVLKNAAGTTLWTQDKVATFEGTFKADLASTASGKGDALVGYKATGTGAVARTLDAVLADHPVSIKDFGASDDCATDIGTALTNAINALPSTGGEIIFPATTGCYALSTAITITKSHVILRGFGPNGQHDGGTGEVAASRIKWTGAAAATMITFSSVNGAANQAIQFVGMIGIELDGNSGTAGIGLQITSVHHGTFERLAIKECSIAGIKMSTLASLADAEDNLNNLFQNIYIGNFQNAAAQSGKGIWLSYDSNARNSCWNRFIDIEIVYYDGVALHIEHGDNNAFYGLRSYLAAGGSAAESVLVEQPAGATTNNNYFYHSVGKIVQQTNAVGTTVFGYDQSNGEADPVATSGSITWTSDGYNGTGWHIGRYVKLSNDAVNGYAVYGAAISSSSYNIHLKSNITKIGLDVAHPEALFQYGALYLNDKTSFIYMNTGSPEGALTAPVGSLFLRTDGAAGTSLYSKESGAGNTGWIALGTGLSQTVVVKGSAGSDCNLVFTVGRLTSTTCP